MLVKYEHTQESCMMKKEREEYPRTEIAADWYTFASERGGSAGEISCDNNNNSSQQRKEPKIKIKRKLAENMRCFDCKNSKKSRMRGRTRCR